MRVALDARWIFPEISGIGAYTRELIRHLDDADPNDRFLLLFNDGNVMEQVQRDTGYASLPNVSARLLPYGLFSIRNQLSLGGELRKFAADVYHSTNYMIPFFAFPRGRRGAIACVVTIHDTIPLIMRDWVARSRKTRFFWLFKRIMLEATARADAVTAVSENSRNDVVRLLHVPEDKVHVIYNGVRETFTPDPRRTTEEGSPKTILYVGRSDPYKNLATLIRAFAEASKVCEHALQLRIAGSLDPRYPEPAQLAEELGVADKITWTGYLTDEELVQTYRKADLLVHPSRYEGFGLQVAEAMASGLPVICSRAASLPEVAGTAAVLLDPDDVAGFAAAIEDVLSDSHLAQAMREKGLKQAARFTWKEAARKTREVYRSVHGGTFGNPEVPGGD